MDRLLRRIGWALFSVLLPAAFFVAGGWLTITQSKLIWNGVRSQHWPEVSGVVISSGWQAYLLSGQPAAHPGKASHVQYAPAVRYRYRVRGHVYHGDRLSFHDYRQRDLQRVKTIVAQYPAGAAVQVHYDPAEPGRAVLTPGFSGFNVTLLGVGLVLLITASGICWITIRAQESSD